MSQCVFECYMKRSVPLITSYYWSEGRMKTGIVFFDVVVNILVSLKNS